MVNERPNKCIQITVYCISMSSRSYMFRRIRLPEDGAPNVLKHVGARYSNMWLFEWILLVFHSPTHLCVSCFDFSHCSQERDCRIALC
jgi:hypothetical protein